MGELDQIRRIAEDVYQSLGFEPSFQAQFLAFLLEHGVPLKGRVPRAASTCGKQYLRAAAIRAGVISAGDSIRFGWHNLRYSLATFFGSKEVLVTVIQKTLRHRVSGRKCSEGKGRPDEVPYCRCRRGCRPSQLRHQAGGLS